MKKINHILLQIGILTFLLSVTVSHALATPIGDGNPMVRMGNVAEVLTDPCDSIVTWDTVIMSPMEMPFAYADTVLAIGTPDSTVLTFTYTTANGCDSISHVLFLYRANYRQACYEYYWWLSGEIYTESGMYFHHYYNANNELATDTLFLTIYSPSVTINPLTPVTVCQGANTEISASVTGSGNITYEWDGPYHHFSSTEPNFSIVNASPVDSGTYTLTVTATEGPCTATDTASVEVSVIPAPEVSISSDINTICQNSNTVIPLTASGATTYHWNTGSSATGINVSPSMSTTYSVTGTDPNGCMGYASFPITVIPNPVVAISGKSPFCSGKSTTLTASASGSNSYSYVWSGGLGSLPSVTVSPASTTTYHVTATDEFGCTNSATTTVTVIPNPTVIIAGGGTLCEGESIELTAAGTGSCSYVWNVGSGSSIHVAPANTTSYSVTATNEFGCTGTASTQVTVNPKPVVSISGGGSICEGESVTLSASGASSYEWASGLGSGSSIHVLPTSTNTYTVLGTNEFGCTGTASATVVVNPKPSVFIMGNAVICMGDPITLSVGGASSYSWSTGSSQSSITETPLTNTTYSVTGTDLNQCQNSASVNVIVRELPQVVIVGSDSACVGETAIFIALGASQYEWSTGSTHSYIVDSLLSNVSYSVTGTDQYGCSNSYTFDVVVGTGAEDEVEVTACESYVWPVSGEIYTASGTYYFQYVGSNGCLSTHTLHLTIYHGDTIDIPAIACEEYTWEGAGVTYTESGDYTRSYTTPEGCLNVDRLHLTINKGAHLEETVSVCEHYIWPVNGYGYSVSDDYVFEFTDTNGCLSTRTLHLTILHGTHEEVNAIGYDSYTWSVNGETYTQSGHYVYHFTNAEGCDCTLTLNLTIKHNVDDDDCIYAFMQQAETCPNGHDGVARVFLPASLRDKCVVYWTKPDDSVEEGEVLTGLTKGIYRVEVFAATCSTLLFEGSVVISKEGECDVTVSIAGPKIVKGGCNGIPSCTFTATATGGAPPYTFHAGWEMISDNEAIRVWTPQEGHFSIGCTVDDADGNVGRALLDGYAKNMDCAQDPNEIKGPNGFDDSLRFVNVTDKMNYTIDFENDPEFAMAPATRVRITYDVPANQRLSSFRLSDFGFGDFVFTVPSNTSSYSKRLDVSDSLGVWVDVNAGIDVVNRQLFWIFQSIDPATGAEPVSSQMGFLPVNDSLDHGEGYVSFYILPDGGVQTGDTVAAEAIIVFDDNAPIGTNVWRNTFDAVAPTSTLHADLNAQDSLYCTFSFTAQDDAGGSGVSSVEVFLSVNNGAYTSIGSCAPDSTLTYTLENGILYQFLSIATDNVGNTEPFKAMPDTTVNYNSAPIDLVLDGNYFYEYAPLNTYIGTFFTLDHDINQHFTYELVSGTGSADNSLFQIVNNELRTNALFECSNRTEYSIRVRTTDFGGLSLEKTFILTEILVHGTPVIYTNAFICQGESYVFNGKTLTSSGAYTDTLVKANGCDSIVTLFLEVKPVYHTFFTEEICESGSYNFLGHDIAAAGVYTDTLQTVSGCDSIFTLTLIMHPADTSSFSVTACDEYVWNTRTYTESGDYTLLLSNQYGCDSVVTMHLLLNPAVSTAFSETACDSYTWNGQTYTQSGDYNETFTTSAGCDSTVTLHLTVLHSSHNTVTETACESFTWHGQTYTASGTYTYAYSSVDGCPSMDTLHLTVHHGTHNSQTETVCGSYTWHGQTYTTSGTYTFAYTNEGGCASVDTLYLTLNSVTTAEFSETACDSYTWNGQTYTQSGDYNETFTTSAGCDSTVTLHLTVLHSSHNTVTETACESFTWHGQTYTASGTYTYAYSSVDGCPSMDTLHLTVHHGTHNSQTETACGSYTWHGQTYTTSGTYTFAYTNEGGCASVDTLSLTLNSVTTAEFSETVCGSYTWNGQTYTQSGDYTYTMTTAAGCDSTVTLHLTISQPITSDTTVSACVSFIWNGITLTQSGNYTLNLTSAAGCDSVVTLHLTIHYGTAGDTTVTACMSYTWNGITLTQSGNYTLNLTSAAGCDSLATLHLTITYGSTVDTFATACESFTWYGQTYTQSGNYTKTITDAAGCDNVITLHLTVNPTYDIDVYDTAVRMHEYVLGDFSVTPTTVGTQTYDIQGTTVNGCDSIIHLNLFVLNNDGITVNEFNDIEVFPNPTNAVLNIKGENMERIWVYNADGQLIYTKENEISDLQQVDVSGFASGQYFVKVQLRDNRTVTRKFVVNRQ